MAEPVVIKNAEEMQARAREILKGGSSIGFVPTMGALHAGHRSLIERARAENDIVVVSIYVNPTQFGPNEDFARYPRPFNDDIALCAAAGVDIVLAPDNLYTKDARTWVTVGELEEPLCGMSRPGHFRGVATVVTKLLAIVRPDRAYFGRKDAQQLLIIQTLVRDLNLGCRIVPCETVRDPDGMAMSSRNRYLNAGERKQALAISKALRYCQKEIEAGERDAMKLLGDMANMMGEQPDLEIDYVAIVDAHTLDDLKEIQGDILVAIAVKVAGKRLIDNIHLEGLS